MSDPWWQSAFVEKALAKAKSSCESFGMSQETPCDDNSKHDDSLNAFLWNKELEAADVEASEVQVTFLIEDNPGELAVFTEQQKVARQYILSARELSRLL